MTKLTAGDKIWCVIVLIISIGIFADLIGQVGETVCVEPYVLTGRQALDMIFFMVASWVMIGNLLTLFEWITEDV